MSIHKMLRTSPHVVCYWHDDKFILHHIPSAAVLPANPATVSILDFFRTWRPVQELFAVWPVSSHAVLEDAIATLVAGSFLRTPDGSSDSRDDQLDAWGRWNPMASLFHFSTKDIRWQRGQGRDAFEAEFKRKAESEAPPPPAFKHHPAAKRVRLPRPKAKGEFARVLLERRTWRGFGAKPLPLDELGQLLDLTWGVQGRGTIAGNVSVAFKTSPSGGARHSIEAYVLALKVKGLPRGLYHYTADTKELELIKKGASPDQLEDYLVGQWYYRPAAAVTFMTAVVAREIWRYPDARSYRAVLFEAGHLCQTFCLVSIWLGLAPFCTGALDDSRIERDLGINGIDEILLYCAGVGTRPADGKWVQWPEHLPGHPYLPPKPGAARRRRPARRR